MLWIITLELTDASHCSKNKNIHGALSMPVVKKEHQQSYLQETRDVINERKPQVDHYFQLIIWRANSC